MALKKKEKQTFYWKIRTHIRLSTVTDLNWRMPAKWALKKQHKVIMNAFSVLFRIRSFNFSFSVSRGCVQATRDFSQVAQEFECSRYRLRESNSARTASGLTQPRNLFFSIVNVFVIRLWKVQKKTI